MNFINNIKNLLKQRKNILLCFLSISIFYLILNFMGITCPIKFITGISCPGCGMTRALISAIKLDFKSAFYYHPLFPLIPISFIVFFLLKNKKNFKYYIYIIFIIFVIIYVCRLLNPNDIVTFAPSNNIFFRLIKVFK